MRLTSTFFASALIRRCGVENVAAAVLRHGSDEAGAIFVVIDRLDGTSDLYAPAPQTSFGDDPSDRLFQRVLERAPQPDIDARLARETKFDPDLWVVAIEDKEGKAFVDIVPTA